MWIAIQKGLAQLLFWIYDFLDTIGEIFNVLTGTQSVSGKQSLLEIFVESAISTKVLLGLAGISIIIAAACMCVKIVKNIVKIKADGEPVSHATTIKQGGIAVLSSIACIFFVIMFISFATMLLNMVNNVISPSENLTLSQNLFNLSVQQSYVIDENTWEERETGEPYCDASGNPVQKTDPTSEDGLAWVRDEYGNYILDNDGKKTPIYIMQVERYHPYLYEKDANGEIVLDKNGNPVFKMETGWVGNYTVADISWSYSPDKVFGVHGRDWAGIFEQEDKGYSRPPMVRLQSFNLLTAYLVAIIMLISMFMLSIGLVKRIYDIIVLIICMPLVCGTIPLDDGARFRAWRETMMSKVLVSFGAVISINVFYMISGYITSAAFDAVFLTGVGISSAALVIFKMVMLLGGAMCINGSQALIARILGTSADESREAMQSFAMITSGVRVAALGMAGVGRAVTGGSRFLFGGTNRYGRERTGILPMGFRGVNAVGEKVGGEKYQNSRGARFVRTLGRMGGKSYGNMKSSASKNRSKAYAGYKSTASRKNSVSSKNPRAGKVGRSLSGPGAISAVGGASKKANTTYKNSTKKGK